MRMNIKQLQKLIGKLTTRHAKLKAQIREAKRLEKEEKRRLREEPLIELVARALRGDETVTSISKSLGVTPPAVLYKIHRVCSRANRETYRAGIRLGSSNNYRTPPLKYLRENKGAFGF